MHSIFIVDILVGIADIKTNLSWSLPLKSSWSSAREASNAVGKSGQAHVWCQCYHSHQVKLDCSTRRFCPCPSLLYIIFLGDSSTLSCFWLSLMILKSITSNSHFPLSSRPTFLFVRKTFPCWCPTALSHSTCQEPNSFSSLPNLLSNLASSLSWWNS